MSAAGRSIVACLTEISLRLSSAAAIAKEAVSCAESGAEREVLRIAMDLDELLHEAVILHGAVALIGRRTRPEPELPGPSR